MKRIINSYSVIGILFFYVSACSQKKTINKEHESITYRDSVEVNEYQPSECGKDQIPIVHTISADTSEQSVLIKKTFTFEGVNFFFTAENSKKEITFGGDLRNPPRIAQYLEVQNGDKRVSIELPKKMKWQEISDSSLIQIVDVRLNTLSFYKADTILFFTILMGGGCQSCNEYLGVYSMDGNIISSYYYNKDTVWDNNFTEIGSQLYFKSNKKELFKVSLVNPDID